MGMEGQYRLVPETLEALSTLRREQCAAVQLAAGNIVDGGLPKSSGAFVWNLGDLPLTTELAAKLVRASPEMLCELRQAPKATWRLAAGFVGFGSAPPSRERLGMTVSATEAVAAGGRLLELVTEALTRGAPPANQPRTLHACWQLEGGHRPSDERLFFATTIVEERFINGDDVWSWSVEFFVAPPESMLAHGQFLDDDRQTRAVRGVSGYQPVATTGHQASLDEKNRGTGAKAASLLACIMSPLLQKANEEVRSRAF